MSAKTKTKAVPVAPSPQVRTPRARDPRAAAPLAASLAASPLAAVRLELAKMRRLRTLPVAALLAGATVALSSMNLFAASARPGFSDPAEHLWEGLLLGYGMMAAITGPVLVSVLASRQTDIEHSGAGWTLFATAGHTPGALCRAKLAALALVVVPTVVAQSVGLVLVARLAGVSVPWQAGPWVSYTVGLILVDLVFCAFHVWLAAVQENQLVGVGVGLLGAFVAVYMLLAPQWVARLVPWGYYAMVCCARISGTGRAGAEYVTPPWGWVLGFLLLAAVLFAAATRRLDRIER